MKGTHELREILNRKFHEGEIDLVDIVPIPTAGDRMVRLRTLEEALEDFQSQESSPDEDTSEALSYLIQVRPRKRGVSRAGITQIPEHSQIVSPTVIQSEPAPPHRPSAATASATGENIYRPDGKLNVPYLAQNADLLFASGEIALARNIYKAISASGERRGMALFGIGRCEEADGNLDEARIFYEESIAYHPTLETYHRLGALFMVQKKDQLAAEVLERALNLKDLEQAVRFELHKASGNCWTRAKAEASSQAAEKHYRHALEIDPAADEIRSNLGALCLQGQRIADARRHFEDALASNPRNENAPAGLASCYLAVGEKRIAHDYFAKALEININNPSAIYHVVKCAYEIRSYATAARLVEEYIRIEGATVNSNLLYSLAGLQFHLGRASDARATARLILSTNAEHSGAKELLVLIDRFSQP